MWKKVDVARRALARLGGRRRSVSVRRLRPAIGGLEQLEGRALLASNADFANLLTHSTEYFTNIIIPAYQKFLNRVPAQSELNYWTDQMHNGRTDESVVAGFAGSPEFYRTSGGTNTSWINNMYQTILGRTPAASEVNYYLNSLANGNTRYNISYGFAASPEHERAVVLQDYSHFLNRTPSTADLNYYVSKFVNGQTNEQVVTSFLGSGEFKRKHFSADANFLKAAYQLTLGRPATAAEMSTGLNFLEGNGLVRIPGSGVYNVNIDHINNVPFTTLTGTLGVVTPSVAGIPNDINSRDFSVFVGDPTSAANTTAADSGQILFATNRALFGAINAAASSQPLVLAQVDLNPVGGLVVIHVDSTAINTTAFQNEFNEVTLNGNTLFKITSGTISIQFDPGGLSFTGSTILTGKDDNTNSTLPYVATFSGTLA